MSVAPQCPNCGSNGHTGGAFYLMLWTREDAEAAGLDPHRTSKQAFGCTACGISFPAIAYSKDALNAPKLGLVDEGGRPVNPYPAWDGTGVTF